MLRRLGDGLREGLRRYLLLHGNSPSMIDYYFRKQREDKLWQALAEAAKRQDLVAMAVALQALKEAGCIK